MSVIGLNDTGSHPERLLRSLLLSTLCSVSRLFNRQCCRLTLQLLQYSFDVAWLACGACVAKSISLCRWRLNSDRRSFMSP